MSSSQNSGGLMSSAGLVRYFDEDGKNTVRVDPKTALALFGLIGVILHAATALS